MANFVSQVDHLQNRETTHFIKLLLVSSLPSGFANDPFKLPFSLVVFFTLSLSLHLPARTLTTRIIYTEVKRMLRENSQGQTNLEDESSLRLGFRSSCRRFNCGSLHRGEVHCPWTRAVPYLLSKQELFLRIGCLG